MSKACNSLNGSGCGVTVVLDRGNGSNLPPNKSLVCPERDSFPEIWCSPRHHTMTGDVRNHRSTATRNLPPEASNKEKCNTYATFGLRFYGILKLSTATSPCTCNAPSRWSRDYSIAPQTEPLVAQDDAWRGTTTLQRMPIRFSWLVSGDGRRFCFLGMLDFKSQNEESQHTEEGNMNDAQPTTSWEGLRWVVGF